MTVLLVGLFIAYYVLMETFWNGPTLGKRMVNLRAVDAGGRPITIKQAIIRTVGRIIVYVAVGLLFLSVGARYRWYRVVVYFKAGAVADFESFGSD